MSPISLHSSPVTVGIIGLGRAGWDLHLKPISSNPGFRIIAVADPLLDRCQEAADLTGCAYFATIEELLDGSDAQLIIVATPSFIHYKDVLKVLNAGRHCIVEKPLALTTDQANELVALAERKGLGLFVHHTHLHNPEFYHLKAVIESGKLGDLFSIRACWTGYARRWDWQTLKKNGGGQLNNTCPHMLSIILPLLGESVEEVFADLRNIKDAGDAEDHVHAVLRTASGKTADIVVSSAMALAGPRWILCGSRGTLLTDGKIGKLRYYDGTKVESLEVLDEAAPGRKYLSETLPWEEIEIVAKAAPVTTFHQNVHAVLTERAEPVVSPKSACEVVRITNLIHQAAERP